MSIILVPGPHKYAPTVAHHIDCPHGRRSKRGELVLMKPDNAVWCSHCLGQSGPRHPEGVDTRRYVKPIGRYTRQNQNERKIPCECPVCGSVNLEPPVQGFRTWHCFGCGWLGMVTSRWEQVPLPCKPVRFSARRMKYESDGGFIATNKRFHTGKQSAPR